ncbi:MAG: methyltransferase domain-containing protein [Anaerolineales bacterium]|nr:methyltransferase domain-containing protein [Anaerolineales bacterium]
MEETCRGNPDPHHLQGRRNYNRMSRWYDLFAGSERRFTEAGLRLLDPRPGERVLEIGFGTGHALVGLARAVGEAGQVDGIDLSPGMLAVARRRLARHGLAGRVNLQLGDATRLPHPEGHFQAALSSFTLELFSAQEMSVVLAECLRVLQTGGRLGLVALAKEDRPAVRLYEWFRQRMPRVIDCRPIFAEQALQAAGFRLTATRHQAMWGLPVAILVGQKP